MYKHTKCGGLVKKRKCQKCGRRWGPLHFIFTTELRPEGVLEKKRRIRCDGQEHRTWIERKFPSSQTVADVLPQWPRWVRILASLVVLALIGLGIWYWRFS